MADALQLAQKIQTDLANHFGQSIAPNMQKMDRRVPLYKALYHLGMLINNFKRQLATVKTSEFVERLIVIADELDQKQHVELADKMDRIIEKSRENLAVVEDLVEVADSLDHANEPMLAEAVDSLIGIRKTAEPVVPGHLRTLSTRYCPDHPGVMTVRISENTYQCPLDGSTYNYETGFQNYKGEVVPGGSVAGQTPETSSYGIPMRFYDSRDTILRSVH